MKSAKGNFYKKQIEDCKNSQSSQWYSKLKRMSKHDQHASEELNVEEISDITPKEQANAILDSILDVNNSYDSIEKEDIDIPNIPEESIPNRGRSIISHKGTKTIPSTPPGDIPAKLVKRLSEY